MKLKERIITILLSAGKPLSFEKVYELLEADGHPMPSDKPKLKVRQTLYNKDHFDVEKGGLFKVKEELAAESPAVGPATIAVETGDNVAPVAKASPLAKTADKAEGKVGKAQHPSDVGHKPAGGGTGVVGKHHIKPEQKRPSPVVASKPEKKAVVTKEKDAEPKKSADGPKLQDRIIKVLMTAAKPLTFEKIYELLESDGVPMPSDKPKLKVRQALYSKECFDVEKGGMFKLKDGVLPAAEDHHGVAEDAHPAVSPKDGVESIAAKHDESKTSDVAVLPVQPDVSAAARGVISKPVDVVSTNDGNVDFLAEMRAKAEGEAAVIRDEARRHAEEIAAKARADARREAEEIAAKVREDARREAEEIAAKAREDARRHIEEIAAKAREDARRHAEESAKMAAKEAADAARLAAAEMARQMAEEETRLAAEREEARRLAVDAAVAAARDAAREVAEDMARRRAEENLKGAVADGEQSRIKTSAVSEIGDAELVAAARAAREAAAQAAEMAKALTSRALGVETVTPEPAKAENLISQGSGTQSIRQRAANAIRSAGRPLSFKEIFRALQDDEYPLPPKNPEEVVERVLKNSAIFAEVETGFYSPMDD